MQNTNLVEHTTPQPEYKYVVVSGAKIIREYARRIDADICALRYRLVGAEARVTSAKTSADYSAGVQL